MDLPYIKSSEELPAEELAEERMNLRIADLKVSISKELNPYKKRKLNELLELNEMLYNLLFLNMQ